MSILVPFHTLLACAVQVSCTLTLESHHACSPGCKRDQGKLTLLTFPWLSDLAEGESLQPKAR